ncbi:MAG: 30S ribosomal protein S11 [Patescibacteria group bacterium]
MPTSKKPAVTKEPKAAKEPKIVAPETADIAVAEAPVVAKAVKASKKQVLNGVVHINISYNNTLIAISDLAGNVIAFSSAGLLGFKGSKKSTPYAANLVAKDVIEKSKRFGLMNVRISVKGVGPARESAIRGIAGTGMNISSIMDTTPVPHNGVKSSKPRRI